MISKTMMQSERKTHLHPSQSEIKLPTVGASNGETPNIKINNENIFALSSTGKKSRTIDMAATIATLYMEIGRASCRERV